MSGFEESSSGTAPERGDLPVIASLDELTAFIWRDPASTPNSAITRCAGPAAVSGSLSPAIGFRGRSRFAGRVLGAGVC